MTIDASGQANLYMSLWDTGTGAQTVMRQIVAETLTLPPQQVRLVMQDTDAVPFESGPGGTRVTYTSGQAAFGAARDLRDKLLAVAAELLEGPVESVQLSQGRFVLAGNPQRALSVDEVVAQATAGTGAAVGRYECHLYPTTRHVVLRASGRGRGGPGHRSGDRQEDRHGA